MVGFQADVVCFSPCWEVTGAVEVACPSVRAAVAPGAVRQSRSGALSAHLDPMSCRGGKKFYLSLEMELR